MATHLITGAGSGIGEAVARALLERGDEVWLLVRDAGRARELAARFEQVGKEAGGRVQTLVGDLAQPSRLSWAFGHQSMPGELDSLLHIAGVVDLGRVDELTPKVWDATLAANLVAPAELTRLLLPQVRLVRGHIVFVNSGAGMHAHPQWSAYAASKHGLRALADSLRGEEAEAGVRVTSVYPGRTATPMQAKVHQQEGKTYDPQAWIAPESVASTVLAALDLPRDGQITDLTVRPGP